MLSNERFALACREWYEEQGLIVDARNGEFAHCPLPKRYGEAGYYLLHEHHQQQGLLQSRDIGECCFFAGDVKTWLVNCDYWPENYFDLWDIYEEWKITKRYPKKVAEEWRRKGVEISAARSPEEKKETAMKTQKTMKEKYTKEERQEIIRKRAEARTPEEKASTAKKSWETRKARYTPEQRSEAARKAWETRRAKSTEK
jgi:hypothetical protein